MYVWNVYCRKFKNAEGIRAERAEKGKSAER
jgi:hypothetical protein